MALTGGSALAQPAQPRAIPTAAAFAVQADTYRRLAQESQSQRAALEAELAVRRRAAELRHAALAAAFASAEAAEAELFRANAAAEGARDHLARMAAAAWLSRTGADSTARTSSVALAAVQRDFSAFELAARDALETARARQAAALRLKAQTLRAGDALAVSDAQLEALAQQAAHFEQAAARADARARELRRDPRSGGQPAPRLAAALLGRNQAETILGYTQDRPGVVLAAAPSLPVRAPASGRIGFTGLFGAYGEVLILELDSGYVIVFSGLERGSWEVGARVRAADVIGVLRSDAPIASEVYVEVRRGAQPVDPERAARVWREAAGPSLAGSPLQAGSPVQTGSGELGRSNRERSGGA